MTVHNYRSRQVHETLNGVNPSSGFRDMRSAKSRPNLWQIWQVFGPWASPYGANGQMSMTVHNYRPRQFHRTSNRENPSSGYRDMGSASLAAARPTARPPARTVTTIPLQPGGLRGKKENHLLLVMGLEYSRASFYYHGLTLIPAWNWISNYIHYKVCDEITYTFPNFIGTVMEVWEWISNFIPHFTGHMITYPRWD